MDKVAKQHDFVLLTSGVEDHAHPPTLEALPKTILIVGNEAACSVARQCGHTANIIEIDHG